MKYIILLYCLIISSNVYTQIEIGPTIGFNFNSISEVDNHFAFIVSDDMYASYLIGLKVKYKMPNNKVTLFFKSTYNNNKVDAGQIGITPLRYIKFKTIHSSLTLNRSFYSKMYLGIGVNHSYYPKIIRLHGYSNDNIFFINKHDIGAIVSLNYSYNKFLFGLNYSHGLWTNQSDEYGNIQYLTPISFFQLGMTYLFPIKQKNSKLK